MTSLSKLQFDTARSAAGQLAGDPPPELEHGGIVVVAVDQAGLIVAAEPVCAALFQWEPAELVGQPLEALLRAGADKIRQHLLPDESSPGSESPNLPPFFGLAQRKDDTTFAVAVTLQRKAGSWWTVALHNVNPPFFAPSEIRSAGLPQPASTLRRRRAQVAAPLELESIPDVFQRAPAKPTPQPEPPGTAPAVEQDQPASATPTPPSQDQLSPGAPTAQPVSANSDAHLQELEQRLSQSAADLQRTRAHLQQQDEQLHVANTAARQATAALEAEKARRAQSEEQLAQARQAAEEQNRLLSAEQQARAEFEARHYDLEQRLAQAAEELQRAQTQTQQPPASAPAPNADEPALQDQLVELENRLRTAVSSLARTTAELETERGERGRSQQRAASLADRMQRLHEELNDHLASEQLDRRRLTELEQQLHEQRKQDDLAVAKLQSALQLEECERKRLEGELLRSRSLSADSARAGRAQVNSLRRQLQPPVESLHHDTCRLLQLQLADDQKQLLQTMLEHILLLQNSLQESLPNTENSSGSVSGGKGRV